MWLPRRRHSLFLCRPGLRTDARTLEHNSALRPESPALHNTLSQVKEEWFFFFLFSSIRFHFFVLLHPLSNLLNLRKKQTEWQNNITWLYESITALTHSGKTALQCIDSINYHTQTRLYILVCKKRIPLCPVWSPLHYVTASDNITSLWSSGYWAKQIRCVWWISVTWRR